MRASVISFSEQGGRLAARVGEILGEKGEVSVFALPKYASSSGQIPVENGAAAWCKERWETEDLLVFVGASGIAVRYIAPLVHSKKTDPAVLVLDEKGNFVISLLSGHLGGANEYTRWLADALPAIPVITTATDVNHKFAVDVWASKNHLFISSMKLAKEVAAAVLAGDPVGIWLHPSVHPTGEIPPELTPLSGEEVRDFSGILIAVSPVREDFPQEKILWLVPKNICLGLGCRRGKESNVILSRVEEWRKEAGIFRESIRSAGSIDLKKEEEGLLTLAKTYGIPFETWPAEALAKAPGVFSTSSFVSDITGVDNVCERAAVTGSGGGDLLMKKQAKDGVTAAAAAGKCEVIFWVN